MIVASSLGSPSAMPSISATSAASNASAMDAWTNRRCTEMHACPLRRNPPKATRLAA